VNAWIAVLLVGAGSYAFRLAPVLALGRGSPPPWVTRVLRLAGPAALTAMAATAVAQHERPGQAGAPLALGAAVAVGALAARRRRPAVAGLAAGLATYWVSSLLIGALAAATP
jgi:branched-subunit amino acid transport protein